jgi:phosphoserine phosphatase
LELVSFDVDGTILRGTILDHVKVPKALHEKIALQDVLFEQGKLGYEERLQIQFALLSGMNVNEIAPDPEYLPLIGDLQTTLEKLKESKVRVVVLTDNPSFAAEPLRFYGFQEMIASEIEVENGRLTDRMKLLTNKLTGLREYCKREGIELGSCAHVGDWINDVVVFKAVGLSVAFNPSEEDVSTAATYTVRSSSLLDVYNVLKSNLRAPRARQERSSSRSVLV